MSRPYSRRDRCHQLVRHLDTAAGELRAQAEAAREAATKPGPGQPVRVLVDDVQVERLTARAEAFAEAAAIARRILVV